MNYTIENSKLKVVISNRGGEILSIISRESGEEYIWQGDEKYWTGHAPLMFPICGRLTEGKYTYKGNTYEMVRHGFLRESLMNVEFCSDDELVLSLCGSEATYACYPFDFKYETSYKLEGSKLVQSFKVTNTGEEELVFGLGAHPAFNVPLEKGLAFEDYYIEFPKKNKIEKLVFSDAALLTGEIEEIPLEEGGRLNLQHSLFDNDAIFMQNNPEYVILKSDKSKASLKVSYDNLEYLGLWHATKTDAPYICIEPWSSLPSFDGVIDDMSNKKFMTHLAPLEAEEFSMEITINE